MQIFLLIFFFSSTALANLHTPPDISFEESRMWLKHISQHKTKLKYEPFIKESIDGGEKMSDWIKLINSKRDPAQAIRLTSKETQTKFPIESPSIYGPELLAKRYKDLVATLPKYLADVIYGNQPIEAQLKISDEEFIKWGRKVSRQYQSSVRWVGMKPWLSQLAYKRYQDVRGFYYLKHLKDLDYQLENIDVLSQTKRDEILKALEGICINTNDLNQGCDKEVDRAFRNLELKKLKDKYWQNAQRNWNRFFKIYDPRKDVEWSQNSPSIMKVIFKDPANQAIAHWLKENVEDEYQRTLLHWNMELSYVTTGRQARKAAYIEFQKNVTPHVTGGNKIVMDANTPLEEYNVKWTIRHEFGHILRLPDCYHEFYVAEENVIINYQLDTTDLMCSRSGAMNDRIYYELKRVYFK